MRETTLKKKRRIYIPEIIFLVFALAPLNDAFAIYTRCDPECGILLREITGGSRSQLILGITALIIVGIIIFGRFVPDMEFNEGNSERKNLGVVFLILAFVLTFIIII